MLNVCEREGSYLGWRWSYLFLNEPQLFIISGNYVNSLRRGNSLNWHSFNQIFIRLLRTRWGILAWCNADIFLLCNIIWKYWMVSTQWWPSFQTAVLCTTRLLLPHFRIFVSLQEVVKILHIHYNSLQLSTLRFDLNTSVAIKSYRAFPN